MRRLIAAWILAVLVAGCGTDEKKPGDSAPPPKASEMFDNKEPPKGAKKGVGPG
jgi:hypothetical protein